MGWVRPLVAQVAWMWTLVACVPPVAAGDTDPFVEDGLASYYDAGAHGKLSAAHRKLGLGTRVRVTRESTRRSVVVTICDRGPFVRGRIIDLSRDAAQELDMISAGITRVSLSLLRPEGPAPAGDVSFSGISNLPMLRGMLLLPGYFEEGTRHRWFLEPEVADTSLTGDLEPGRARQRDALK